MDDRQPDSYFQDEMGQWYCLNQRSKRRKDGTRITVKLKVFPQTCEHCGKEFVNRHTQKLCSRPCQSEWEVGRPKKEEPPRPCPICGTLFGRTIRRPWRQTCGDKKCARALADQHPGYLSGPDHPNWKGGKRLQTKAGYVMVYAGPGAPSRLEHRVVMEEHLGRPLMRNENVHHLNGIRNDNRIENLELWAKCQLPGQRVKDLLTHARWILETYEPLEDKL